MARGLLVTLLVKRSLGTIAGLAGLLLMACAPSHPGPAAPPRDPRETQAAPAGGGERVEVGVDIRAPLHARYERSLLGPSRPTLAVVVTNRSNEPLDVEGLRVRLEAVREGVSFRCADEVGAPMGAREPSTVAPSATAVFERTLDCALPLVGAYGVRVAVSFGHGAWARARDVKTFTLDVTAPPDVEPRPITGVPGLWAALGASGVLVTDDRREGHGRIAVAIVNGSPSPIELPRLRLALRVYRVGSAIPCEDEPVALGAPEVLGAGAAYREPVDVSCLGLGVPGRYEVAARLLVDPNREVEIGRLRVDVAADPAQATWKWWP